MKRYQDYVIKDGKFVGQFEEMYKEFDDPWHQSEVFSKDGTIQKFSFSRNATVGIIKKYGIKSLVEFGCGLGHTTQYLYRSLSSEINIMGVDISETAIKKAKLSYPHLSFATDNVINIDRYSAYQNVLFAEITWYLLEDDLITKVFEKMLAHFKGNYFIHNLVFYHGQQKYGNQFFTNLDEFIDFCPFEYIGSVKSDFLNDDTSETSSIFKIVPKKK